MERALSTAALEEGLSVFANLMQDIDVTEIIVNRPCEICYERLGQFLTAHAPLLTTDYLRGLSMLIAANSRQDLNASNPLLSATLPDGTRVQIVIPGACPEGRIYMVFRKHRLLNLTLEDYATAGIFSPPVKEVHTLGHFEALQKMKETHDIAGIIQYTMANRITLLISGATATGKTALLNTCLKYMPMEARLISIEDTEELKPPQKNVMSLLYSRGAQGVSKHTAQDLLEAALRLRPERIIFQELRGSHESAAFLRAINSGHQGSIATIHANSAALAYEQIALMVLQSGLALPVDRIIEYAKTLIPVVLQYSFVDGHRKITEVYLHANS